MSIGRHTSMLSSSRIIVVTLLASFLQGVRADCYHDSNGYEICDGASLSGLEVAMICLIVFAIFLAVIFSLFAYRRERKRQANLACVEQSQRGSGATYESPYSSPPSSAPQYPPLAHNSLN